MKYQITETNGVRLVVFVNALGEIFTATEDNPQIETIIGRLRTGDTLDVEHLFSLESSIAQTFESLSERVSLVNGKVLFDGDAVDPSIERLIVRLYQSGDNSYHSVVNFMEKVYTNVDSHTRENLFTWLAAEDFSITADGDIVAYKGLNADGTSIHAGPAFVDGKPFNGHVPNEIGSTISISREDVVSNPAIGCAYGLHAGTYEYANAFARGLLVEVHINPRDVVSVPTDCNAQKMRVSRYRVVRTLVAKHNAAVVDDVDDDFDVEYEDNVCYDC